MDVVTISLAKKYVDDTANGLGAVKGANGDAVLDSGEQGGGNMIYTGWTNAPMAVHFFNFSGVVDNGSILSIETDVKTERFLPDNNGMLGICIDGNAVRFPLVNDSSASASAVKLFANGTKQALAHLA